MCLMQSRDCCDVRGSFRGMESSRYPFPTTAKRDLSKEQEDAALNGTVRLGTAVNDHQNVHSAMDSFTNISSGEREEEEEQNAESSVCDHNKRSKQLEDLKTSDGNSIFDSQENIYTSLHTSNDFRIEQHRSLPPGKEYRDSTEDVVMENQVQGEATVQVMVVEGMDVLGSEDSGVEATECIGTQAAHKMPKGNENITSSTGDNSKLSCEHEEDLYRDEDEIEKEKNKKIPTTVKEGSTGIQKLGVGPEMDIMEYSQKEWRGKTTVAKIMKEGYEEVSRYFGSIRRVRGDNYCALRATLFQALSQTTSIPVWLQNEDVTQLPKKLVKKYDWINLWQFWYNCGNKNTWVRIQEYLELLKKRWSELSEMTKSEERQAACDEIFTNEQEEYCLYEAVKFLMLKTAIDLFNASEEGKEVPVFSWLLFARNTSSSPCEFMKNHLNQVGHSGGLEQCDHLDGGFVLVSITVFVCC
ncbi:ubiquitin thioesterase otulin isoform X2 [Bombina bombina]|uniref:ubiquitin thioesterase otulin isoform X2 n=1 Tax=Bombina bombina TaxID=8345 RepID=UPI00235A934E|nr:ubiquitin thioesterase otulin isoform X2 [Bombina bombina]